MKRKLLQQLLIFIAPFLAYFGTTGSLAFYSGEFTPLRQVAAMQSGDIPVLYGRAYKDNYFTYKLVATEMRTPEVLVLGSSRTNQFRSKFFNKKSAAFYSASQAVQSIYETRQFLESLDKNKLPK